MSTARSARATFLFLIARRHQLDLKVQGMIGLGRRWPDDDKGLRMLHVNKSTQEGCGEERDAMVEAAEYANTVPIHSDSEQTLMWSLSDSLRDR